MKPDLQTRLDLLKKYYYTSVHNKIVAFTQGVKCL